MTSIIAGYNNLTTSGQSSVAGERWTNYQLSHYEPGSGCFLSEALEEWEEVDEEDEKIVVSTPGLPVPDEYEFEHEWILLKREENGERSFIEVCVTSDHDGFGRWFDTGCPMK